jgi:hypothetical protein
MNSMFVKFNKRLELLTRLAVKAWDALSHMKIIQSNDNLQADTSYWWPQREESTNAVLFWRQAATFSILLWSQAIGMTKYINVDERGKKFGHKWYRGNFGFCWQRIAEKYQPAAKQRESPVGKLVDCNTAMTYWTTANINYAFLYEHYRTRDLSWFTSERLLHGAIWSKT